MTQTMTQLKKQPMTVVSERSVIVHAIPSEPTAPTHADIARRAYEIYIKSGRVQGQCLQNWQQAERTLYDQREHALQEQQLRTGTLSADATEAP